MMRQMPRPQPFLNPARRPRKMNPIMNQLVPRKPGRDPAKKNHPRRSPEKKERTDDHNNHRNPRPKRENCARIPMMHLMQPAHERPMRMSEHAMDDVLEQRPRKHSSRKDDRIGKHNDSIVSR